METAIAAREDFLIDNLMLQAKPAASYVLKRRNATIHSAINSASPAGVSTMKFNIASSTEWVDPHSIVVSFVVNNLDAAKALKPATVGVHGIVDRLQVRFGGQLVEDIDHYGTMCEAFERCVPVEKRVNFGGLGFGQGLVGANLFDGGAGHAPNEIAGGASRRVFMRLALSGLSSCQKWIPVWAVKGGIEVYLTLAQPRDCMVLGAGGTTNSNSYSCTDLRLECDMLTLDAGLDESYRKMLEAGQSLKIHFKSWNMTSQYIPAGNGGNMDLSLQKAYAAVANVFAVFTKQAVTAETEAGKLPVNTFAMFPAARETLESTLTLGSKRYPDFPNRGITEHYWRLMNALGVALSLPHSINIDYDSFASNSFIWAAELEKVPQVWSSGESTQGGQELSIHLKGLVGAAPTDTVTRAIVAIHHEKMVDITAGGIILNE